MLNQATLSTQFAALADLGEDDEPSSAELEQPEPVASTSISRRYDEDSPLYPISKPLVWCDLEMTGLDLEKDTIIEIACCVSSGDMKRLMMGPNIAINHTNEVLDNMNDWCLDQHAKSGLIERCRSSRTSMREAEQTVLKFLRRHCLPQKAQMAGNSVHVDKAFIRRHMPELHEFLHFRIVDVSSVNELCKRWFPGKLQMLPHKVRAHTAMKDLLDSFNELRFYKSAIFGVQDKAMPVIRPYSEHTPED